MSQRGVERVIGRLVTDEAFRRKFAEDPAAILREALGCGVELTSLEVRALASIDPQLLARLAENLDPRIQKICVEGGCS
jgi:Ribosomally synthesized peptide prototyped by Frankia Franean1_4349.